MNKSFVIFTGLIIAVVAMSLEMMLISNQISRNRSVGNENQRLIKIVSCIVTIPATTRTQKDIDACWDKNPR